MEYDLYWFGVRFLDQMKASHEIKSRLSLFTEKLLIGSRQRNKNDFIHNTVNALKGACSADVAGGNAEQIKFWPVSKDGRVQNRGCEVPT